ncbi:MAG: hypothetical protein R2759_14605 [Bacteroidales bacterium]
MICLCQDSVSDSIQVTVFRFVDWKVSIFEKSYNPGLPFDVYGEITGIRFLWLFHWNQPQCADPSYTFHR